MAEAAPAAPTTPQTAPTNGAHPGQPQPPSTKLPPAAAAPVPGTPPPEVDDSEEYTIDGKTIRLTKAQRQLHLQKGLAADKRIQEATELKRQEHVSAIVAELRSRTPVTIDWRRLKKLRWPESVEPPPPAQG